MTTRNSYPYNIQETLGAQTKLHTQNVSNQQDEDQHFSELYFSKTGEQLWSRNAAGLHAR